MELRSSLFFFLFFSVLVISYSVPDCVYTIYIQTGSVIKGGTDSKISATFYTSNGHRLLIKDLEGWGGLMGADYDYFERGNVDIFSGRGPCLSEPICGLNLTSDGTGKHHGWFVEYVEMTSTGVHTPCQQNQFVIQQWLSTDTPPYNLTAITDSCHDGDHDLSRRVKTVPIASIGRLSSVV